MKSLNICVVSQQAQQVFSGIGLHTHNLCHALAQDGHRVILCTPRSQAPAWEIPFKLVSVPDPVIRRSQARWFPLSLSFNRRLTRLAAEESIDLIHFTDARESFFYRGKVRAVGNINDTYSADLRPYAYYRQHYQDALPRYLYYQLVHRCERSALKRLARVLANSEYTRSVVQTRYHLPPSQVLVCPKSIDDRQYQPVREQRAGMAGHPLRVLFVGTNMQRKGLPTLIRAAGRLAKTQSGFEVWVVGDDPVVPQLKALCVENGVSSQFKFLGWQPQSQLQSIYANCDLFVMPSLVEAFGMVFLEAMASGLVAVGTNTGGIPEIIQHDYNGLLVPVGSPEDLAQAIARLASDPALRLRLQVNGIRTAQSFSVERMMAETYAIYRGVLSLD